MSNYKQDWEYLKNASLQNYAPNDIYLKGLRYIMELEEEKKKLTEVLEDMVKIKHMFSRVMDFLTDINEHPAKDLIKSTDK
jgi:hypothetical protein